MTTQTLTLAFKGTRTYIQGPDLFNAMMVADPDIPLSKLRFTVHGFVHSPNCLLHSTDSKLALNEIPDIRARCQFDAQGRSHWLALTELPGDAQTGPRAEYDEQALIGLCQLDGDRISLDQHSPFSFIESIVSMNKYLHQQLFKEVTGKWLFTRIDLDTLCDNRTGLALHFKHNMNFRLTKSDILVDQHKVGELYFSLVDA